MKFFIKNLNLKKTFIRYLNTNKRDLFLQHSRKDVYYIPRNVIHQNPISREFKVFLYHYF